MKPHYYQYEDPAKQTVYYRGYVKEYTNSPTVFIHTCPNVHKSKFLTLKEATKLIETIRKNKLSTVTMTQPV